jgi:hypothetical protein
MFLALTPFIHSAMLFFVVAIAVHIRSLGFNVNAFHNRIAFNERIECHFDAAALVFLSNTNFIEFEEK